MSEHDREANGIKSYGAADYPLLAEFLKNHPDLALTKEQWRETAEAWRQGKPLNFRLPEPGGIVFDGKD